MKRILTVIAVVAVMMIAASIAYFAFTCSAPGRVDAPKILAAAQAYAHDLQARGSVVPASVALQDLVSKGLLNPADVSGFAGMEVTISLTASDRRPQDILMRVRMHDGSQMVALADGSVLEVPR
ncbi:MAG: hypothetical protein ABSA45_06760 [Verrucomicrobiota bacterium]|jgi:hypothetical protein